MSLEAAMLRTLGKNAPTIDNLLVLAQLFKVDISEIVVSATIEVSLPCSEHRERPERQNCECRSNFSESRLSFCETDKTCMNDQGAYCEQCRFKKSA